MEMEWRGQKRYNECDNLSLSLTQWYADMFTHGIMTIYIKLHLISAWIEEWRDGEGSFVLKCMCIYAHNIVCKWSKVILYCKRHMYTQRGNFTRFRMKIV